jgi:hypothetical protein
VSDGTCAGGDSTNGTDEASKIDIELKYVLADIATAITAEISAAKKNPLRFFRISHGERLHAGSDGCLYKFHADLALPVQPDTPIRLYLENDDAVGGALVVQEDFDLVLDLREDLGEEIAEARLSVEPWFIYEQLREKLKELADDPPENMRLPRALLGLDATEAGEDRERAAQTVVELRKHRDPSLVPNDDQQIAIGRCTASSLHFVWGPPGTGKTACLAQVTRALRDHGERVLVLAHANAAVDVAMIRVADVMDGTDDLRYGRVLRVGTPHLAEARERDEINPARVLARKHPDLLRQRESLEMQRAALSRKLARGGAEVRATIAAELKEVRDELGALREALRQAEARLIEEATVLGTTLSRLAIDGAVWSWKPDAVLVDEASMGMFPAVLAASFRARCRVLIFGDFRQLPPIYLSNRRSAVAWLGRDAFDIAGIRANVDAGVPDSRLTMLQVQHRMAAPICRVVSELAYGGRLRSHPSIDGTLAPLIARGPFQNCSAVVVDTSALAPACFREPKAGSYSRCNPLHAAIVATLVAQAQAEGFASIGIVSPYRAQAALIAKVVASVADRNAATVATVHRFQGSERDLIIFDLTDSRDERGASRLTGRDLDAALRLVNVALSRARGKLLVVADCDFVRERHSSRSPARGALRLLGDPVQLDTSFLIQYAFGRGVWFARIADATEVIRRAVETTAEPVYVNVPEHMVLPAPLIDLLRVVPDRGIPVTVFASYETAAALETSEVDVRLLVQPAGFFVLVGARFAAIGGREPSSPVFCLEDAATAGTLHQLCVGATLAKPRPSVEIDAKLDVLCGRCPECGDRRRPQQVDGQEWRLRCGSVGHAAVTISKDELQRLVATVATRCPQCGAPAIVRASRGGFFLGCENFSNGCRGKLPKLTDIFGEV